MNKLLSFISLLFLLFTTISCDKDDFELGSPVIEAKLDSLSCRIWLHNVQGDTTNVFHKGEDIRIGLFLQSSKKVEAWVYESLRPNDIGILFYRNNGDYVGGPFPYNYQQTASFALLANQQPIKIFFNLDKLDNGKRLSKGEYFLLLQYRTTLYRNVNIDEMRVCQNRHILIFMRKAPTFSSPGFVIS